MIDRPKAEAATAGRRSSGAPAEGQPRSGGAARERKQPRYSGFTRVIWNCTRREMSPAPKRASNSTARSMPGFRL